MEEIVNQVDVLQIFIILKHEKIRQNLFDSSICFFPAIGLSMVQWSK